MESEPRSEPVFYPVEDRMPDTKTHLDTRAELMDVVARHLRNQGRRAFVSSDQFVYWVEGNPRVSIAPDLYVVLGAEPAQQPDNWKTWEQGVPELVIEVVSRRRRKDYDVVPGRYDDMGVTELVIFDPHEKRTRVRWQHFRRLDDRLVCVERTEGPRIWSSVLEAWLVTAHHPDGTPTVRVATGAHGADLVPRTADVLADRESALADKNAALAEKDEALAEKDEALAEKDEALAQREAELETLRQRLADLEGD